MSKNTVDDLVCREERKDYYNVEDLTCKEEPKKEYVIEDLTCKCEALQMYCEHCQEIVNKDDWCIDPKGQLIHKCGNPIIIKRGKEVEGTDDEKLGYTWNAQCALNQQAIFESVRKDIDKEILNKLKEIAENDLKVCHSRRNAKSGMDCIRLTGKNPYVEQEEQKKMKVRK